MDILTQEKNRFEIIKKKTNLKPTSIWLCNMIDNVVLGSNNKK